MDHIAMEYIAYSVLIIFGDIDGLFFNITWSTLEQGVNSLIGEKWEYLSIFFIIKLICC